MSGIPNISTASPAPTHAQPTTGGNMELTLARICTAIIVVIVVIIGGVVVLTTNDLSYDAYLRDVAIGVGLLGVGHGLDSRSTP